MSDQIMEEVYATRQRISGSCGHDVGRYLAGLKGIRERARAAGLSFADYCLKFPSFQPDSSVGLDALDSNGKKMM